LTSSDAAFGDVAFAVLNFALEFFAKIELILDPVSQLLDVGSWKRPDGLLYFLDVTAHFGMVSQFSGISNVTPQSSLFFLKFPLPEA